MHHPRPDTTHRPPAAYLWILLGSFLLISTILSLSLPHVMQSLGIKSYTASILSTLQLTSALLTMVLPVYLAELYCHRVRRVATPLSSGRFSLPGGRELLLLLLLFAAATGGTTLMSMLNKLLYRPEQWGEAWAPMIAVEQTVEQTLQVMLSDHSLGAVVPTVIALVVVATLSEELFFRGALMGWLIQDTSRVHLPVFLTAAIFALVHFQFTGFLPRFYLGVLLGYIAVYLSLESAILFHLLNNLSAYLTYRLTGTIDLQDSTFTDTPRSVTLLCIGGFCLSLLLLYLSSQKQHPHTHSYSWTHAKKSTSQEDASGV